MKEYELTPAALRPLNHMREDYGFTEGPGFLVCGYVLMPNHWHALLVPSPPLTISRVVRT
jgi:REP element-mobilizing transposase RayT